MKLLGYQIFTSSHILIYVLHRIRPEQGFYMLIPGVLPVLTSLIPKMMAGQPELANVSQQVLTSHGWVVVPLVIA